MDHKTLFKMIIPANSVVFDIGGHSGSYASIFSRIVRTKGKVFSFEPHPEKYSQLKTIAESCTSNNIFPHCLAVSDTIGTTVLYFGNEPHADGASTICVELATQERLGSEIKQIAVKTTALDCFCKELNILPDFVKIDVEGAENKVIAGMVNVMEQSKPTILFECGLPENEERIPQHFIALRNLGYTLWVVDIVRFLGKSVSWDNIVDSSSNKLRGKIYSFSDDELMEAKPALTNMLAVHRDQTKRLIPNDCVIPLTVAFQYLRHPKRKMRSIVIKYMPEKFVQVLRSLKSL